MLRIGCGAGLTSKLTMDGLLRLAKYESSTHATSLEEGVESFPLLVPLACFGQLVDHRPVVLLHHLLAEHLHEDQGEECRRRRSAGSDECRPSRHMMSWDIDAVFK